MENGFKVVPDIYKRGNGRWAKVVRQHDRVGEPINGIQMWKPKYSVAFGTDGQWKTDLVQSYAKKVTAISVAETWIEYGQ